MLPDLERAERVGEFWSYPQSRTFAELLIDCEEDRAMLVGMLREAKDQRRSRPGAHGHTRIGCSHSTAGTGAVQQSSRANESC
jgi:hypothetical protein